MDSSSDSFAGSDGYVVIVYFQIHIDFVDVFREALKENARKTLEEEQGCWKFEVSEKAGGHFFLYEVYVDENAFRHHLLQPHFIEFDLAHKKNVMSKQIDSYHLISLI